MLSNHLISIRNVSSLLTLCLILSACSSGAKKVSSKSLSSTERNQADACESPKGADEIKYLTTAAQAAAARNVGHCFEHYIKFETNKKQTLQVCNTLTVKRSGDVTFIHLRGYQGDRLPKDIQMCMVQEFTKMNFSKMQLDNGYTIRFPIKFSSM